MESGRVGAGDWRRLRYRAWRVAGETQPPAGARLERAEGTRRGRGARVRKHQEWGKKRFLLNSVGEAEGEIREKLV